MWMQSIFLGPYKYRWNTGQENYLLVKWEQKHRNLNPLGTLIDRDNIPFLADLLGWSNRGHRKPSLPLATGLASTQEIRNDESNRECGL